MASDYHLNYSAQLANSKALFCAVSYRAIVEFLVSAMHSYFFIPRKLSFQSVVLFTSGPTKTREIISNSPAPTILFMLSFNYTRL